MTEREELLKIHGDRDCHICGRPKIAKGANTCSYPHAMVPVEQVSEGMWAWATYGELAGADK